jgi:hypothetical protein
MRAVRVAGYLVVASLCLLAGCQRQRTQATPAGPQPLNVSTTALYRHPASGMEFPTKIDEFARVALVRYDKAGQIVSGRYDIDGATSKIIATVFVYPVHGSASARAERCQRLLTEASADLVAGHPGARPTGTDDVTLDQEGRTHAGRHATFFYDEPIENDTRPATAQLYLFCDAAGPWQLEYRFTHPRELNVAPIIDDFMRRLTWTLYPE